MSIPEWQRRNGERFGPFSDYNQDPSQASPVIVVRDPFIPATNDRVLGPGGFIPYRNILTVPANQVIQIVPQRFFDAFSIAVRDPGAHSNNRIFGRFNENLTGVNGLQNYPGGVVPSPIPVPDFTSELFTDLSYFRIDVPYGTMPFWFHMAGSVGNTYQISVSLFNSGY